MFRRDADAAVDHGEIRPLAVGPPSAIRTVPSASVYFIPFTSKLVNCGFDLVRGTEQSGRGLQLPAPRGAAGRR